MRERTSTVRMTLTTTTFVLLMTAGMTSATWAQSLDRGPYLQQGTPTSVIVKWDTSSNTDSRVTYGTDVNNLNLVEEVSGNLRRFRTLGKCRCVLRGNV